MGAGRGIDVQQVQMVVNFDLPWGHDQYLHRIGRAGRFGKKGLAINFVSHRDMAHLQDLQQHYRTEITELPEDFVARLHSA
eukprot:NODE_2431_length_475_cov_447.767606_g1999_i0.p1 GENE.NODE_2431_length_475_cov_447.767606_g1999_i0~~NODE_2431_length_475_cov_447.767606_g1999_i0.p1  ORF type:complete len:81 (-),score=3.98 NODE_2431_length_475_cov_447.767606_g1999_i0:201-443(-)